MAEREETVRIAGQLGVVTYTRTEDEDTGETELRLQFQRGTFSIKDALKQLRFWCHMSERVWVLAPDRYSDRAERKLRYLLQHGELPPPGERLPRLPRPAAAAGPSQQQQQQQTPALQPAAAAPHSTPRQRERRRPREEAPQELEFSDGMVSMRREADGRFLLEGSRLTHIRQQLERILRFERLPQGLGELPAWRSGWALDDREQEWVAALLEHRARRLREGDPAPDEKDPLPPGAMPQRFKPRAADGRTLRGPNTTRNGLPHNIGRKFFSTFDQTEGGFVWADGTRPFNDEAQGRFAEWAGHGGLDPGNWMEVMFGGGGGGGGGGIDGWEEEEAYGDGFMEGYDDDEGGEEDDSAEGEEEDAEGSAPSDDAEGGGSNEAEEEEADSGGAEEEPDSDGNWRPGDD